MMKMVYKLLSASMVVLLFAVVLPAFGGAVRAQSGLYVPSAKPVKNMQRALTNPAAFYLLLCYGGQQAEYAVGDLDLLDSAFRIAFDIDNPMYYTMTIESYGSADESLGKARVDAVYRYFAQRTGGQFPVRMARNPIHCSCNGDTVETLRFEVPVSTAFYDCAGLPEARRLLNKSIKLDNSVLVTFRHDPDECVGAARGCYVPAEDSIVRGYYASLFLGRGSIRSVDGTKDTCPSGLDIRIDDHLDYRAVVEQYRMIPHRKQLLVQAGYVVLSSNWDAAVDSCPLPQKDSIFIRVPVTKEQLDAKLKFFAKVRTSRGLEYKQLPTRKAPGRAELMLQAPINVSQFDTVYLGKRVQESELKKYFYPVDGSAEAASFRVGDRWYVAYRPGKNGTYELKKPLRDLFRIVPDQEEEQPDAGRDKKTPNPEEIIED